MINGKLYDLNVLMGIGPTVKKVKEPNYNNGPLRSSTNDLMRHRRGPSLAKSTKPGFQREWTKNRPPAFVKHFDNFTIVNSEVVNKPKKEKLQTEDIIINQISIKNTPRF